MEFLNAIWPTIFNNLELIGVYVILALGLNMINGMAGMFSLGHAGFWAIGAYTSAALTVYNPMGLDWRLAFLVGIVAAVILAGVAGLIIAVPCLRLAGDYLAIATLGFGIIIVSVLYNWELVGAARGFTGIPVYASKWVVWLMVAVTLVFYYRVQFSNLGRKIQALREDEIAAQSIGIDRMRTKTYVFVIGAAIAGLAGAMYANSATYLNPAGFEFDQSIKVLTMVVLGGLGSITGVTVAAIGLTLMPEFLRLIGMEDYQMLIFAGVLLAMVLTRPQGIMGQFELWDLKVFRNRWRPHGH
jgi:branched-chain amino acid transport system permease protein